MTMPKRGLQPNDLYIIKCVGGADVSPDGRLVAYVVQRIDEEQDKSLTDIYLCDLNTLETKRLTSSGKDNSPCFSPDGKRLAFTSSRSDKNQIYILDLDGGEAWQLPTAEAVGGAPVWFPDGIRIAYTAGVFSQSAEWQPYPGAPAYDRERLEAIAKRDGSKDKQEDKAKQNNVKVITHLSYRRDGVGYFGEKVRQVFVTPVPTTTPSENLKPAGWQVTSGNYNHSSPAISPCGRYLVTSVRRSDTADYDQKGDLWLWDLETKNFHWLYDGPGPVLEAIWSPDGRTLAFGGHDFSHNVSTTTDLWLLDVADWLERLAQGEQMQPLQMAQAKNVTRPFDRPFGAHAGAELRYGGSSMFWQGSELYFLMSERGAAGIYRTDATGQVTPILLDADLAITSIAGNAAALVYTASQPNELEELYLHDQGEAKAIGRVNEQFLQEIVLGNWEKITYESEPDVLVDGWIVYPMGYEAGKKYPLLLLIHGGPHGAYGPAFLFSAQVFAAQGYVVLFTNPRGSTTYGQDFTCAIDKNWGVVDYLDIMRGVDEVIDRGLADPERLFVHGWSFGGYMTCWLVTQTNRFRAACGGANVANMLSGYGTSDIIWSDEYEYGGQPWKDYVHLIERSPIGHVHKVETPIMLLHGEDDLRCPIGQSEEFYASLKRLGKEAVMIRYPGEYHGLKRPLHRVDRYERLLAWFNHYQEV